MSKLKKLDKLSNQYTFSIVMMLSFIVSCIFTYKEITNLDLYQTQTYPYILSTETKLAVPECIEILDSLKNDIIYSQKYQEVSRLYICLNKTPLYSAYKTRISRVKEHLYLIIQQPESLDLDRANNEYNALINDLSNSEEGIPALQNYRLNFVILNIVRNPFIIICLSFVFFAGALLILNYLCDN